ncbi:MAG: hypothetical protein EP305_06855 [Bacteroidetes bacterium]|nr:MAG: hypothetical protein EP305_06855 [Bacteroidota bacterium]
MKNLLIASVFTLSGLAYGQGFLFMDFHAGSRLGATKAPHSSAAPGLHMDASMGYMFNEVWGMKGSLGYDGIKMTSELVDGVDKSKLFRASLEAVADVTSDRQRLTGNWRFMFHFGTGLSTHVHKEYKETFLANGGTFNDPFIKGNDDMINILYGFNPRFMITPQMALEGDLSMVFMPLESHYMNRIHDNTPFRTLGVLINASIGLSFQFK